MNDAISSIPTAAATASNNNATSSLTHNSDNIAHDWKNYNDPTSPEMTANANAANINNSNNYYNNYNNNNMNVNNKMSLFNMFAAADKLDLSGLLNVLDGVVDTPGRIVVMTTPYP